MVYLLSGDEVSNDLASLNYLNTFSIERSSARSITAVQKELEADNKYRLAFIDVAAVNSSTDAFVEMVERLRKTVRHEIVVVAQGYDEASAFVRDLHSVGIQRVIVASGVMFKREALQVLQLHSLMPEQAAAAPQNEAEPHTAPPPAPLPPPAPTIKEQPAPEPTQSAAVRPPSQVPRAEAKAMIEKPFPAPATGAARVIALAGGGTRIGTTTQAMQLALYLKAQDESVAVVQMHKGGTNLDAYLKIIDEHQLMSSEHFIVSGLDIYRSSKDISKARKEFHYLVLDYGDFNTLPDTSAFLDKEIKVIVGGIKPWESDKLNKVFDSDDGSIKYIFSFVPEAEQAVVIDLMRDSGGITFFAPYAPDYWSYCGADAFYQNFVTTAAPARKPKAAPKRPLIERLREPFIGLW